MARCWYTALLLVIFVSIRLTPTKATGYENQFKFGLAKKAIYNQTSEPLDVIVSLNSLTFCASKCGLNEQCLSFYFDCSRASCKCTLYGHYLAFNEAETTTGKYGYLKSPGPPKYSNIGIEQLASCDVESLKTQNEEFSNNQCFDNICAETYPTFPFPVVGVILTIDNSGNNILTAVCSSDAASRGSRVCDPANGQWVEQEMLCIPTRCQINDSRGNWYAGTVNVTKNGLTCQQWTDTTPHSHQCPDQGFNDDSYSKTKALNYCRDPDLTGGAWCYTTSSEERWEMCDVPFC